MITYKTHQINASISCVIHMGPCALGVNMFNLCWRMNCTCSPDCLDTGSIKVSTINNWVFMFRPNDPFCVNIVEESIYIWDIVQRDNSLLVRLEVNLHDLVVRGIVDKGKIHWRKRYKTKSGVKRCSTKQQALLNEALQNHKHC